MEIAPQHPETHGEGTGENMEEGLLFNGIGMNAAGISVGDKQLPAAVVPNLAHTRAPLGDGTAMTTCHTADLLLALRKVKLPRNRHAVEEVTESGLPG